MTTDDRTAPLTDEEEAELRERVRHDGSEARRPQQRAYLSDVRRLFATLDAARESRDDGLRAAPFRHPGPIRNPICRRLGTAIDCDPGCVDHCIAVLASPPEGLDAEADAAAQTIVDGTLADLPRRLGEQP